MLTIALTANLQKTFANLSLIGLAWVAKIVGMKICQVIRSMRESKKLSAEHLALCVGVEISTITRAERGERRIPTDLLEKIAVAMDIGVTDLYAIAEGRVVLAGASRTDDSLELDEVLLKLRLLMADLSKEQRALILELSAVVARSSSTGKLPSRPEQEPAR